jgi:hypothetical protein
MKKVKTQFERDTMRFYRKEEGSRVYEGVHASYVASLLDSEAKRRDTAHMVLFKLVMGEKSPLRFYQDIAYRIPSLLVDDDSESEANPFRVDVGATNKAIDALIQETYQKAGEFGDIEIAETFITRIANLPSWKPAKPSEPLTDDERFRRMVQKHKQQKLFGDR